MSAARRARQRARRAVEAAVERIVMPPVDSFPATIWADQEGTWWQGEPVTARKVAGRFGADWRPLVEITDRFGRVRYIDDIDGRGWAKVTVHRGAPSAWHRDMRPQEVKPHG